MRSLIAILAAKAALKVNRLTGTGGSSLPGMIAKRLDKDILRKLVINNFPKGIIVITGTNGKTTTASMVANVLEESGISFIHNRSGSNMERGLISTIVESSGLDGKILADVGLFEVDEAYMPKVCRAIRPDWVIVTNLFRDQLDRYGELDKIARNFRNLFEELPDTKLVLNADDPLVASLGYKHDGRSKAEYFGIGDYIGPKLSHDRTADSIFDPFTQEKLHYTQKYFGHIGRYRGKPGEFTRPKPEYSANSVKQIGIDSVEFVVNKSTDYVKLSIPGLFNVYNAIAAFALSKVAFNLEDRELVRAISGSLAAFGRSEKLSYEGRDILMLLIKNPTGLNQVIQTYLLNESDRLLVFVINDNYADGRDVSWLWDAAIEDLATYKGKIMVSGSRARDMALRLKYAGLEDIMVVDDSSKLLEQIKLNSSKRSKVFILPTYTAMLAIRSSIVSEDEKAKEFWQ